MEHQYGCQETPVELPLEVGQRIPFAGDSNDHQQRHTREDEDSPPFTPVQGSRFPQPAQTDLSFIGSGFGCGLIPRGLIFWLIFEGRILQIISEGLTLRVIFEGHRPSL